MTTSVAHRPVVGHLSRTYYGLSENWIHTQVRGLRRYEPLVLTWALENITAASAPAHHSITDQGAVGRIVDRVGMKFRHYAPGHLRALRRHRAVLLHAHFGHRAYHALPLVRASRLPLVTTFYGDDVSRYPRQDPAWRERYGVLFASGVRFLVEGRHMARQLEALGCPPAKIEVHHLGVPVPEYPFVARVRGPGEPLRILASARFTEKKGLPYAAEAFGRLLAAGVDAELTIVGDSSGSAETEAEKKRILDALSGSGALRRTRFLGLLSRDALQREYLRHHVFLSPSIQARDGANEGGAPVSIIEAAATGMPVVATFHCDIPEVVVDGRTGLLAPEGDAAALAHHLAALAGNPQMLGDMGSAARKHIETEYAAEAQAVRLEQIYDAVLATNVPRTRAR